MQFQEIFAEYYALFRGRSTNLPSYGDREFGVAIQLGNNAIRKWDRADGQLWRELIGTAQNDATGDLIIDENTLDYSAPTTMRKPPAFVRFYSGTSYFDIPTVEPQYAKDMADTSSLVWFEGGANTGYTMWISQNLATNYNEYDVDYTYVRKPTLLSTTEDPSETIVDMSDPNFMIQDMTAARSANSRNSFLYKLSTNNATLALANMKIENNSGTYGNTMSMLEKSSWGTPSNGNSGIRL